MDLASPPHIAILVTQLNTTNLTSEFHHENWNKVWDAYRGYTHKRISRNIHSFSANINFWISLLPFFTIQMEHHTHYHIIHNKTHPRTEKYGESTGVLGEQWSLTVFMLGMEWKNIWGNFLSPVERMKRSANAEQDQLRIGGKGRRGIQGRII